MKVYTEVHYGNKLGGGSLVARQTSVVEVPGSNQASTSMINDPDALQDHCVILYNLRVEGGTST